MEKLLLDTQNETRSQPPWVICRLPQKEKKKKIHVCVYDRVSVCTHLVFASGKCVCLCSQKEFVLCPRTGNKTPVFPSPVKFFMIFCSHECNSTLFISFWVQAVRTTNVVMFGGGWFRQHSHKMGMNVFFLKLCTRSIPVWICQHDGARINIFKHFFLSLLLMMSDIKDANTESNNHQMQDDR